MIRAIALICLALMAQGCAAGGATPRTQTVSRAEMAGIVRPAGPVPTGMAEITVPQSNGGPITVRVDRASFWRETGIILPEAPGR